MQDNNTKLDKILDDVGDIKVTLGKHEVYHERNTASLELHMARTEAAEKRIELLQKEVTSLEKHKEQVVGALKILMVIGTLVAALHSMGIMTKLFGQP